MPKPYIKSRVAKSAVRFVLDPLGFTVPRAYLRHVDDQQVHFFHMGRCAGTTIKDLIEQINQTTEGTTLVAHEHKVVLANIPEQARYFFAIREPVDRFFSAFNWRQARQKLTSRGPDSYSQQERKAFARFASANELAESLFADGERGIEAFTAMQEIKHVNRPMHSWFSSVEEPLSIRPPLCIIRLEKMQHDLNFLVSKLEIDNGRDLASKERKRHLNVYVAPPPLSELAIENLRRWYATDIQFYELAKGWAAQHQD